MTKIKTELEQKISLLDCLNNVKQAVNNAGGDITEDTPYDKYGEKVQDVAPAEYTYYPLSAPTGTVGPSLETSWDDSIDATFEFNEADGLVSIDGVSAIEDGENIGTPAMYILWSLWNTEGSSYAMKKYLKIPAMAAETEDDTTTYSFERNGLTYQFSLEQTDESTISYNPGDVLDENKEIIGFFEVYWAIE